MRFISFPQIIEKYNRSTKADRLIAKLKEISIISVGIYHVKPIPKNREAYLNLYQTKEAIVDLLTILEIHPDDDAARLNLACAYEIDGYQQTAYRLYKQIRDPKIFDEIQSSITEMEA